MISITFPRYKKSINPLRCRDSNGSKTDFRRFSKENKKLLFQRETVLKFTLGVKENEGMGRPRQERPQQLPGPAQPEAGPADPQHRSAAFSGKLPVELTAAWADNNFLRFFPPQFPQATRSISLLAINISVF
jgi:hypothetical protein